MPPTSSPFTLATHTIDAVLFDLDGVVTQTADLHAAAWKEMFDGYLKQRAEQENTAFEPFVIETDYRQYVDGKPRYEGVKSFLASRNIELPDGDPNDSPNEETICGLGNKKNDLFHQRLKTQGADVFETTVTFIRHLRDRGIKTAIVSSSKNCAAVLESAQLAPLFDTRVDGVESTRLNLKGKPAPDIFLEAAKRLGVAPSRAVVVEDAEAGVQAGRNGRFGLVIGVAREGSRAALKEHGADVVVADLQEVDIHAGSGTADKQTTDLPSALNDQARIVQQLKDKRAAVFLDYDGTLTPIVDRPDHAFLSKEMRSTVRKLSRYCPVAIISGRDLADVQKLVQIDTIFYAGSHGFDIAGPQGLQKQHEQGTDFLPVLEQAEEELRRDLAAVEGARLERKKFSIAVHFRAVAQEAIRAVEHIVDDVVQRHPKLRKGCGKKVYDLQPRLDWQKGKAVVWLLEALALDTADVMPFYIGDDLTDEDAFQALANRGLGIVVEEELRPTAAQYVLKNPDEVKTFLQQLLLFLEK